MNDTKWILQVFFQNSYLIGSRKKKHSHDNIEHLIGWEKFVMRKWKSPFV